MKTPVVISVLVLLCGCNLSMERIPTSAEIKNNKVLSQFLIEADEVQGHYQNMDVDSVVFSYSTRVQPEDAFWQKLNASLQGTSWKAMQPIGAVHRFERRFARGKGQGERTDMAMFSSAEETRISYQHGRVVVAWVQADSSIEETSFAETSEARFADGVVWPKFEALSK